RVSASKFGSSLNYLGGGKFAANALRQLQNRFQRGGCNSGVHSARGQRAQNSFGRNISDKLVARKGTSAKSSQRAIKSPASGFIRGGNFCGGVFGTAVQVNAKFDPGHAIFHRAIKRPNLFGVRGASCIRKRNT